MKMLLILCSFLFFSNALSAQCKIKEESLSNSSFTCPDIQDENFSQQISDFCKNVGLGYHLIFFNITDQISYSLIINDSVFQLQSGKENISLSKRQRDKLNSLTMKIPLDKRYTQHCVDEVQFGGQTIEFSALKIDGVIKMIYWSAGKNGESVIVTNDNRLLPLINLLNYLNKISK